ncbi:hypothetical protein ABZ318_25040 [Streptomyces sp. NPDC006197]|uniref:hypothetical protein n=1 Tax=Streptomyces sp. NPDC006197 TaxID=3156685 RepID=UPI0033BEF9E7
MSISPIPVLRGSHGTVLKFTGDALMWSRNAEEVSIPLQAIAHIRTAGRTVTVELVAPAGTAPAVHRVDGVSEAAAALFAPAVTAALPVRDEEAETVDGSTMVTAHTVPESEDDRHLRKSKNVAFAIGGASLVFALPLLLLGHWVLAPMVLIVAAIGLGITLFGAALAGLAYEQWYLPRYGITVEVERVQLYSHNGTAAYAYTDPHGEKRRISGKLTTSTAHVAYHPSKPDKFTLCNSPFKVASDMFFALVVLLVGLALVALVVYGTGDTLLGGW